MIKFFKDLGFLGSLIIILLVLAVTVFGFMQAVVVVGCNDSSCGGGSHTVRGVAGFECICTD